MISFIKGQVINVSESTLIVATNNIGYEIYATQGLLSSIKLNDTISLWLEMVVGERDLRLFGFKSIDERTIFKLLNSVSGIGPKSALGVLDIATPEQIKQAVINDSVELFTSVSGIGRKNASRIIIELKTKFTSDKSINPAKLQAKHKDADDVISALMKLGYKRKEIEPKLSNINPELTTEQKIKEILKAI